jgi:3-hydroxybutyryl-CoA dehydrogenase
MNIDDVHRVLIVGSGTMGLQIGLQCATHGHDVAMYDLEPAALDAGARRMRAYAEELVAAGRMILAEAGASQPMSRSLVGALQRMRGKRP